MQGWGEADDGGRLILPPELVQRYGLDAGARFFVEESLDGLVLRRPTGNLAKVYIEVTNACNLECRTCIRNSWGESPGWMSARTFDRIAADLGKVSPAPSVFFGGFGEPLSHSNILGMRAAVKAAGAKAELITNGTLLTSEMSRRLIEAGLDRLWVSLDGARPESYADIRLGAELPKIVANVAAFRDACFSEVISSAIQTN
jgi:MoaA/NifB/PqqE/SkfB family radical SAM enzyme